MQITEGELDAVATASTQFDQYLLATYGKDDIARAQEKADRGDATFEEVLLKTMREMHTSSSSSRRHEAQMQADAKGSKRKKKKGKEAKKPEPESGSSSSSSSESSD